MLILAGLFQDFHIANHNALSLSISTWAFFSMLVRIARWFHLLVVEKVWVVIYGLLDTTRQQGDFLSETFRLTKQECYVVILYIQMEEVPANLINDIEFKLNNCFKKTIRLLFIYLFRFGNLNFYDYIRFAAEWLLAVCGLLLSY